MNGGSSRLAKGFTIVETMIVLAISMTLFISVLALINGKQRTTAFTQSIRAVQTQLQQVINEVNSGYYVNDGTITCDAPGGVIDIKGGGSDAQGSNVDCVFMGKVVQFGVPDTAGDGEVFNSYTLVGLQSAFNDSGSSTLGAAKARLVARASGEPSTIPDDLFDTKRMQFGLVASRNYNTTHGKNAAAVGFVTNLSSLGAGDGSQRTDVVSFPNMSLDKNSPDSVLQINNCLKAAACPSVNPASGVKICFNSATEQQSGLLSLGGSGRQGKVEVKIFSAKDCP